MHVDGSEAGGDRCRIDPRKQGPVGPQEAEVDGKAQHASCPPLLARPRSSCLAQSVSEVPFITATMSDSIGT